MAVGFTVVGKGMGMHNKRVQEVGSIPALTQLTLTGTGTVQFGDAFVDYPPGWCDFVCGMGTLD